MKTKLLKKLRAKYHFQVIKLTPIMDQLLWCRKSDMVLKSEAVPSTYMTGFDSFMTAIGWYYRAQARRLRINKKKKINKAKKLFIRL